jgi:hypothetical protein
MTPPARDSSRALIDRISSLLPDRQLREVRMFGVLALMVDGAMAVAAHEDGSLLVRVDPAEDARLLETRRHPARRWEQVAPWAKGGSESRRRRCAPTQPSPAGLMPPPVISVSASPRATDTALGNTVQLVGPAFSTAG